MLISLDGLSAEQFEYLSTSFDFRKPAPVRKLTGGALNSAHGLWAELLSGRNWWETGCVGYAFPKNTLNDLEIGSHSDYAIELPNRLSPTLNVPLLDKNESNQRRPFTSPVYYLGNPIEGTKLCLEAEKHVLTCLEELCRQGDSPGIIRLSVFDHLSHLLGSDYLTNTDLTVHQEITAFIEDVRNRLEYIVKAHDLNVAIISPYGHIPCNKRANINLLLSQLGFCKLKEKAEVQKNQALRHASTIALATKKIASPLISYTCEFIEEATIAASPVHGAIYINRKDRFQTGIVETHDVERITQDVAHQVRTLAKKAGIANLHLEINPNRHANNLAPDLMLYADGVDFHNTYDAPAVDSFGHPKTCHTSSGFICLENAPENELNCVSLSRLLKERLP